MGKKADRMRGYGPQWERAFILIAWQLYLHTGDARMIERYYPSVSKYVDYLSAHSEGNLISFGVDDHKQLSPKTEGDILSAGYCYHLTHLLSSMAAVIGRAADAEKYAGSAKQIKDAFNRKYLNVQTAVYGKGGQTQLAEPLYFKLVPDSLKQKVIQNLLASIRDNKGHIETGVVGTKFLIHALMKTGNDSTLYSITSKTDFPGWGFWIKNGATTLYQNWDQSQSQNHVMFGSITDYFYQGLGGLHPDASSPGFKKFLIKPLQNNLIKNTSVTYESPYGAIGIAWEKGEKATTLKCIIPANTTAYIYFPSGTSSKLKRKLKGTKALLKIEEAEKHMIAHVGSGEYLFSY